MLRLDNFIILGFHLHKDCLVTHKNDNIQGRPLVVRGTFHAPLRRGMVCENHVARGHGFWKPCLEVEGGKEGLIQQATRGPAIVPTSMDLILPRTLVSRVFVPTNCVGKMTLPFLLSDPLLGVFSGGIPFLSIIIFIFYFFLSSSLQVVEDYSIAWNAPNSPWRFE
jgi:hypothetical protein